MERGWLKEEASAILNEIAEAGRGGFRVAQTNDLESQAAKDRIPRCVVLTTFRIVVHPTVDFDNEPQLRAVEVHDEAANGMLAAELEAETPAILENLPAQLLGPGGSRAEAPSGFEFGATRTMPRHTRR